MREIYILPAFWAGTRAQLRAAAGLTRALTRGTVLGMDRSSPDALRT